MEIYKNNRDSLLLLVINTWRLKNSRQLNSQMCNDYIHYSLNPKLVISLIGKKQFGNFYRVKRINKRYLILTKLYKRFLHKKKERNEVKLKFYYNIIL